MTASEAGRGAGVPNSAARNAIERDDAAVGERGNDLYR